MEKKYYAQICVKNVKYKLLLKIFSLTQAYTQSISRSIIQSTTNIDNNGILKIYLFQVI